MFSLISNEQIFFDAMSKFKAGIFIDMLKITIRKHWSSTIFKLVYNRS